MKKCCYSEDDYDVNCLFAYVEDNPSPIRERSNSFSQSLHGSDRRHSTPTSRHGKKISLLDKIVAEPLVHNVCIPMQTPLHKGYALICTCGRLSLYLIEMGGFELCSNS